MYGGMEVNQAHRLKEPERESGRVKKAVADPTPDKPTQAVICLACRYGSYGYRRIHRLPGQDGRCVGLNRVKRIRRREGLKVHQATRETPAVAEGWIMHPSLLDGEEPCPELW